MEGRKQGNTLGRNEGREDEGRHDASDRVEIGVIDVAALGELAGCDSLASYICGGRTPCATRPS